MLKQYHLGSAKTRWDFKQDNYITKVMEQKPQNKRHRNEPQNNTNGHNELFKEASEKYTPQKSVHSTRP